MVEELLTQQSSTAQMPLSERVADMGEYVIGTSGEVLVCRGLGSCVGLVLYDSQKKIAALAHIMLPSFEVLHSESISEHGKLKFADIVIPTILQELRLRGAKDIVAKMAGGAQMFKNLPESSVLHIGNKNVTAIKLLLEKYAISLLAQDVLGNEGRTICFTIDSTFLEIKSKSGVRRI